MRTSSKLGWVSGIVVLAVAFGGGIGWWLSRQGDLPLPPVSAPAVQDSNAQPAAKPDNATAIAEPATETEPAENTEPEEMPAAPQAAAWEDKLEQILLGDGDEDKKANSLLDLINGNPSVEVKTELCQHLVNMVQDDHYEGAAELLTNATTAADVSRVLMNDLLNRNDRLKLSMLLVVASNDEHPLKGEAKEMLELFLQEDKGTNWTEWDAQIQTYLKENEPQPEEGNTEAPKEN